MLKEHLSKRNVRRENYYRLNVEVGVGEFGMNEWTRLADISTSTRRYLARPEVQGMNLDAASKLAKIMRAHLRQEAHAAGLTEDEDNGFGSTGSPTRTQASNHQPSQSWSSNPLAVELPAEDVQVRPPPPQHGPPPPPSRPSIQLSPASQEKFTIIAPDVPRPASSGNTSTVPSRRSGSDVVLPFRNSNEQQHRNDNQPSPRRSSDVPYNRRTPPPLPPKTPIPYPDDERGNGTAAGGGDIPMPEPLHLRKSNGHSDASHLPYPDTDGPPPAVNKLRKPKYNIR